MTTLGTLIRIEAIKAAKRPAFWITIGFFAAIYALAVVDFIRGARRIESFSFSLPESWPEILGILPTAGTLFVGVLIILLFAPEFSWRTGRQNVIDGLSKTRLYVAKVFVLAGLVPIFVAIAVCMGVVGTLFSPSEPSGEIFRAADYSLLAGCALTLLLFGSLGLMLSALIRSPGSAIGVFILCFLVEKSVIELMERAGDFARRIAVYFPSNVAEDIGSDLAHNPEALARVNVSVTETGLEPFEFLDVEILVAIILAYSTLFLVTGLLSMRARDL